MEPEFDIDGNPIVKSDNPYIGLPREERAALAKKNMQQEIEQGKRDIEAETRRDLLKDVTYYGAAESLADVMKLPEDSAKRTALKGIGGALDVGTTAAAAFPATVPVGIVSKLIPAAVKPGLKYGQKIGGMVQEGLGKASAHFFPHQKNKAIKAKAEAIYATLQRQNVPLGKNIKSVEDAIPLAELEVEASLKNKVANRSLRALEEVTDKGSKYGGMVGHIGDRAALNEINELKRKFLVEPE